MPSRAWYVVAAVIFFGAVAGGIGFLLSGLGSLGAGLVQVVVPGSADLDLKEAGTYTVFHEYASQADGRVLMSSDITGLRVTVRPIGGGRDIAVTPPSGRTRYSLGGRSGRSVLAFAIETPGMYRLSAQYDDGRREPQAVLAVGSGFAGGLLTTIIATLAIVFAGLTTAIILTGVSGPGAGAPVAVRHDRAGT